MTEQQRPDEDVEGHMPLTRKEDAADEVEGHARRLADEEPEEDPGDDVEGHGQTRK
jgi:hypothetical protein